MLMIGTGELAKRLYETWRARMELLDTEGERYQWVGPTSQLYPKWEHLDSIQQAVWRSVSETACKTLADAMGAR